MTATVDSGIGKTVTKSNKSQNQIVIKSDKPFRALTALFPQFPALLSLLDTNCNVVVVSFLREKKTAEDKKELSRVLHKLYNARSGTCA